MALRALLAAVAAVAVAVGFILPSTHRGAPDRKSQIEQIELGRR
jgi:hypothetical protein